MQYIKDTKQNIAGVAEYIGQKNRLRKETIKLSEKLANRIGREIEMGTANFNIHKNKIIKLLDKNDGEGIHTFINKQRLKYLQQKRDEISGKRKVDYWQ